MTEMKRALAAIERHGVLLVYPLQNRREPLSLWHALHPRSEMRWAWDDGADPRVVALWHLREQLATSRQVVYAKWHGGRATFFSRDVFRAMLATLRADHDLRLGLSRDSQTLLQLLEDDSPQATKQLREAAGLQGRPMETAYTRAMRDLWSRMLVVGAGEVAEGGFPSLAIGATQLLFEDLWEASAVLTDADAALLERTLADAPSFARTFRRVEKGLPVR
ncbi:AlkZ-related protein [Chondromyces apiculatus]|uniref:Uncharacterized protein n=1 Tax=Chondromyces apiculatus DSM 436 TaxID=1192034 RepID=A0A017TGW7_9BACT|nr:hypothetical protein [Chondromyces apiculatus]EYF08167.1 Hypothetical protein CAP_5927 [Chondromyces apiculatus DSM 436]